MRRLLRELKELRTSPPEGIRVQLSEESVLDVVGIIEGPGESSTIYLVRTRVDAFCRGHAIPRRVLSCKIRVHRGIPCCTTKMYGLLSCITSNCADVTLTGWFATKIFHPNVSNAAEICVNTLKKDWKSSYGIGHILITIKCLLIYPNPDSALDEEAGKVLLESYESYCERAKLITSVPVTPKARSVVSYKIWTEA
jgi:ubiquitin-conjugating enzyme E2 S